MPEVLVNGESVEAHDGELVIDLLHRLDIEVPHFCYHPELSLAGACRMCMVEIDGAVDVSCTRRVEDEMEIVSDSEEVVETRRGILEFMLINHPLDCPVCDKGGECPLQDYTMGYGPAESRFHGNKRSFPKMDLGELLTQRQNRCILCYRCTRFYHEEAGREDFRVIERGDEAFVGKKPGGQLESELSGNMVDICPTGTIVTKPYLHESRPWDNEPHDTVSAIDPLQTPVTVDVKGNEISRIRPQEDPDYAKPWIDDKVRFTHQYVASDRRIGLPRDETYFDRFDDIVETLESAHQPAGIISGDRTFEEQELFQRWFEGVSGTAGTYPDPDGIEVEAPRLEEVTESDLVVVVGTNFRNEYPMLTPFLREAKRNGARLVYLSYWGDQLTIDPDIYCKERPEKLLSRLRRIGEDQPDDPTDEALLDEFDGAENAVVITCEGRALSSSISQHVAAWESFEFDHMRLAPGGNARAGEIVYADAPSPEKLLEQCAEGERDVLVTYGLDLLQEYPDRTLVREAIDAVDELIVIDYLENDSLGEASHVLPLTTQYEESGLLISAEGRIRWSPAVVDHESRTVPGWKTLGFAVLGEDEVAAMDRTDLADQLAKPYQRLPEVDSVVETEQSAWLQSPDDPTTSEPPQSVTDSSGSWRVFSERYLYSSDRRCQVGDNFEDLLREPVVECNRADAEALGADQEIELEVEFDGETLRRPVEITNNPPEGSLLLPWNLRGDETVTIYEGSRCYRRVGTVEPADREPVEA